MCISSTEGDPTSVPPDEQRPEETGTMEVAEMAEVAEFDARVDENADTLGAVGEAGRTSNPVGVVGILRSTDVRAGLGYLLALLKAQRQRLRQS